MIQATLLLILSRRDMVIHSVLLESFARCTILYLFASNLPSGIVPRAASLCLSPICKQRRNLEVISFRCIHYSWRFEKASVTIITISRLRCKTTFPLSTWEKTLFLSESSNILTIINWKILLFLFLWTLRQFFWPFTVNSNNLKNFIFNYF